MAEQIKQPPTSGNSSQEKLDIAFEIARPEDWKELSKIRREALEQDPKSFYDTNAPDTPGPDDEAKWRTMLENPKKFFVFAKRASEVVGFIGALEHEGSKGSWYVHWAYIKRGLRGQNTGERMGKELLEEIKKRGGTKADGWILRSNENAGKVLALFEKLGFREVDKEKSTAAGGISIECDL